MEVLISSEWPGNVRELKNLVESMTLICPEDLIEPAHLPERFSKLKITNGCIDIPLGIPMREVEQILIVQTLASVGNNKSRAAKILGLSRKALYNKLEQYGLP
jgi:DNA-binding NtrC family response regulator